MFKVLAYYEKGDVIEIMPKKFIIDGHALPKVIRADKDYIFEETLGLVPVERIEKEIKRAREERKWNLR